MTFCAISLGIVELLISVLVLSYYAFYQLVLCPLIDTRKLISATSSHLFCWIWLSSGMLRHVAPRDWQTFQRCLLPSSGRWWRNIPQNSHLLTRRRENLKYHNSFCSNGLPLNASSLILFFEHILYFITVILNLWMDICKSSSDVASVTLSSTKLCWLKFFS
jgi:hypothetical protein